MSVYISREKLDPITSFRGTEMEQTLNCIRLSHYNHTSWATLYYLSVNNTKPVWRRTLCTPWRLHNKNKCHPEWQVQKNALRNNSNTVALVVGVSVCVKMILSSSSSVFVLLCKMAAPQPCCEWSLFTLFFRPVLICICEQLVVVNAAEQHRQTSQEQPVPAARQIHLWPKQ